MLIIAYFVIWDYDTKNINSFQKVIKNIVGNELSKKLDTFNHTKEIGKVIKHLHPKIYNPKMDRSTTCFRTFLFKKMKNDKKSPQKNSSLNSSSKGNIQTFSIKNYYQIKATYHFNKSLKYYLFFPKVLL